MTDGMAVPAANEVASMREAPPPRSKSTAHSVAGATTRRRATTRAPPRCARTTKRCSFLDRRATPRDETSHGRPAARCRGRRLIYGGFEVIVQAAAKPETVAARDGENRDLAQVTEE